MRLSQAINNYLSWKHTNGYAYLRVEQLLNQMQRLIGDIELADVKPAHMLICLNRTPISSATWSGKYWNMRRFFEYCCARDAMPPMEMPPPRINRRQSFIPHVFTTSELRLLLAATKRNKNVSFALDESTFRTIIVLLYATDLPVGEIPAIRESDLDLIDGFIHIRSSQPHRNRRIPIGSDLCEVLRVYRANKVVPRGESSPLFQTRSGGAPCAGSISRTFFGLRRVSGVHRRDGSSHQPRVSDLRFTFAVHRISAGIKNDDDLNRLLPALAAYMGQVGLGSTPRYLALTPERFRKDLDKLSPKHETGHWKDDLALIKFLDSL
jgi:integrase/recombinase XerD